jgi:hypothetical protein
VPKCLVAAALLGLESAQVACKSAGVSPSLVSTLSSTCQGLTVLLAVVAVALSILSITTPGLTVLLAVVVVALSILSITCYVPTVLLAVVVMQRHLWGLDDASDAEATATMLQARGLMRVACLADGSAWALVQPSVLDRLQVCPRCLRMHDQISSTEY